MALIVDYDINGYVAVRYSRRGAVPYRKLEELGYNDNLENVAEYFKTIVTKTAQTLFDPEFPTQCMTHGLLRTFTEEQKIELFKRIEAIRKYPYNSLDIIIKIPIIKRDLIDVGLMMVIKMSGVLHQLFADKFYISNGSTGHLVEQFFDEDGYLPNESGSTSYHRISTIGNTFINDYIIKGLPVYQFRIHRNLSEMSNRYEFASSEYHTVQEDELYDRYYKEYDKVNLFAMGKDNEMSGQSNARVRATHYKALTKPKTLTIASMLHYNEDNEHSFKDFDAFKLWFDEIVQEARKLPNEAFCLVSNELCDKDSNKFDEFVTSTYGFQLPENVKFLTSTLKNAYYSAFVGLTLNNSLYDNTEGYQQTTFNRRAFVERFKEQVPG